MKWLSRILIALLLLQAGGLYFLNQFVHYSHQRVVLKEKKNHQLFSFTFEEFSKLEKEGKKEFLLGGVWYDIENLSVVNNKLQIEAYPDKHEKKLKDLDKSDHEDDYENTKVPEVKSIDGNCVPMATLQRNDIIQSIRMSEFNFNILQIYSKVVSPPPELV